MVRGWIQGSEAGEQFLEGVDSAKPKPPVPPRGPNILQRIFAKREPRPEQPRHIQSPLMGHPPIRRDIPAGQRGGNRAK